MRRQIGDQQRMNERLLDIVTQSLSGKKPEVPKAPESDGPPKREDFETYEAYLDAKTDWNVQSRLADAYRVAQQRQAQEAAARSQAEWQKREEKAASERYRDYAEKVWENESLDITAVMAEAIKVSEIGPDVAYYLGSNPTEATRISQLTPAAQAAAIGKIEAKLETELAEGRKPKPSNAPAPTNPVKPTAPTDKFDLSQAKTQKEYEEMRAAQMKAQGRAGRW
jgi:hypothetical protein